MFNRILLILIFLLSFFSASSVVSAAPGYPVKVFFSKESAVDFYDLGAVNRISPTLAVGTYAVEEVVKGPTASERNRGLFSQLHYNINGPSDCSGQNYIGGSDFLLNINSGKATIRFCRMISSAGTGDDARITMEIRKTLLQFSSVQKVVILTKSGNCFGDMSGMNMCLK